MDWTQYIEPLFNLVLIPLLLVLTKYGVAFLSAKCDELREKSENELHDKYITMLQETVTDCVLTTTQTYVEALKNQGSFNEEAQKQAFNMTKDAVLAILNEDAKEYLTNVLGDFDKYLGALIESQVLLAKAPVA